MIEFWEVKGLSDIRRFVFNLNACNEKKRKIEKYLQVKVTIKGYK